MDSRLTRRLAPWLKSVAQERAHSPARLRHPPAKARGGVFFEADFHDLTERGLKRLAVAGFVNPEDWQCLLFHRGSFAETALGANSNHEAHGSVAWTLGAPPKSKFLLGDASTSGV
jgi:hypothetical protein